MAPPLSPRVAPRSLLTRSQFVRLLADMRADMRVDGVDEPRQTLAERLAPWLAWTDAIALFGALDGGQAAATLPARPGSTGVQAVVDGFARERLALARAVCADASLDDDLSDSGRSTTPSRRTADPAAASAPGGFAHSAAAAQPSDTLLADDDGSRYRRHYVARQRLMHERIAPLRARLRAALSARSPALRRLAALDAVLEQALAARERELLATVPALLERHLARVNRRPAPPQGAAPGEPPSPPDDRLRSVQQLLLAELDIRLQPVQGLVDALNDAEGAPQ